MCGSKGRTIDVRLNFLGEGTYHSSVVRDEVQKEAVVLDHANVDQKDSLKIEMRDGGGFLGRFTKKWNNRLTMRAGCRCWLAQQCIFATALPSLWEAPLTS